MRWLCPAWSFPRQPTRQARVPSECRVAAVRWLVTRPGGRVRGLRTASRRGRWRRWGPLEDGEGQRPQQRYPRVNPERERIAVVLIIPPPQKHRGPQRPGKGHQLDVALQPTEGRASKILADHRP